MVLPCVLCAHHVLERLEYPSVDVPVPTFSNSRNSTPPGSWRGRAGDPWVENGDRNALIALSPPPYINKPMWERIAAYMVSEETRPAKPR